MSSVYAIFFGALVKKKKIVTRGAMRGFPPPRPLTGGKGGLLEPKKIKINTTPRIIQMLSLTAVTTTFILPLPLMVYRRQMASTASEERKGVGGKNP
jgi:hypothetical protein